MHSGDGVNYCIDKDPERSYCYTIPDSYDYYDQFDYNSKGYHGDYRINAGNTIKMSRMCNPDWHMAGTSYDEKNSDGTWAYGCEYWEDQCNNWYDFDVYGTGYAPMHLQDTPDGFESHLNCPQCGCTPGQNDAPTIQEIVSLE